MRVPMRVLMLGWEYPPHITGGLGNACRGLARALVRQGVQVRFIMPRPDSNQAEDDGLDTVMIDPAQPRPAHAPHASASETDQPPASSSATNYPQTPAQAAPSVQPITGPTSPRSSQTPESPASPPDPAVQVWQLHIDTPWQSVYPGAKPHAPYEAPFNPSLPIAPPRPPAFTQTQAQSHAQGVLQTLFTPCSTSEPNPAPPHPQSDSLSTDPDSQYPHPTPVSYPSDPVAGARAFADAVIHRLLHDPFDLIHANDWVTFPAALALGKAWGVPVVLHVHSLERDRSPLGENPAIRQIEAGSVALASAVIAVSRHTRADLIREYAVDPNRAFVVYNGVELTNVWANLGQIHRDDLDRIGSSVLFLGRVTAQKGPVEFLHACAKVAPLLPHALFVIAGDGDLLADCKSLAHELGLDDRIVFTGFLSESDVQQALDHADVLVVPSLSEPFGLVVLEAASRGVPSIVSRHAGVAEAMNHLITCDPANAFDLADKILAVLRHGDMREELRIGARAELLRLSWDAGARRCLDVYRKMFETKPAR
jgi:glycogen synthase